MPRKVTEAELIGAFARSIDAAKVKPRGLVLGVGDDAAAFRARPGEDFVVTQDVLVEGRHFELRWFTGRELGWRLAAVNLSDVAAMGAQPRFALFSLVLPRNLDPRYVKDIEKGIVSHLARYNATVIGGNVSGTSGPLTCDLTLIGAVGRGEMWRRRARAGDAIVVVGWLGEAAAGLDLLKWPSGTTHKRLVGAYKKPKPLVGAVRVLRGEAAVHGAIDVSDGFSTDLSHVCTASGLGCDVDASRLPVSKVLARFCEDRRLDPLRWVMRGGEDYALILGVAQRRAIAVCRKLEKSLGVPARVVGRFTKDGRRHITGRDGKQRRFVPTGWDHLQPRR
jgi:thiamine-monophosphate kinase